MKHFFTCISTAVLLLIFSDARGQTRYLDQVFANVQVDTGITYGENFDFNTNFATLKPLVMDVYRPLGDTLRNRPIILLAHNGSFLDETFTNQFVGWCFSGRKDSSMVALCTRFAKMGYVAVSFDYRLGWSFGGDQIARTKTILQATYRAAQDAKTLVRYFKNDYANTGNNWGVDTGRIILGGSNSGANVALAAATLNDTNELYGLKFVDINGPFMKPDSLGDFDGFGGVLNHDNYPGISSRFAGVLSLGGAVMDTSWIQPGEVPVIAFHGIQETSTPYNTGIQRTSSGQNVVEVSGSGDFMPIVEALGNNSVFAGSFQPGPPNRNGLGQQTIPIEGLYPFYGQKFEPWNWYDTACYNNKPVMNTTLTTGTNSIAQGNRYIDTIMAYAAPRLNQLLANITAPQGPLMLSLGADQTTCTGSSVTLNPTVSGGVAPYTYLWSAVGNNLSCANCKNPVVALTQNSVYAVTVIDAANTQVADTISYTVTAGSNTIQFTTSSTTINCLNPQAVATVVISGGTSPYTLAWGDGGTSSGGSPQQHNYSQAGSYVIAVTDAGGCSTSNLHTVTAISVSVTTLQKIQPGCRQQNTGKIKVSGSGGTAPYTYLWNTNATADSIVNVPAGTYVVTITDATSCSAVAHLYLSPASGWNYYAYLIPSSSNCGNTGSVTNVVTGGTLPYTYTWTNGDTTQNLTGIAGNAYRVTVTDALGCTTSGSALVPSQCFSFITGTVFNDTNNNCVKDAGEFFRTNMFLMAKQNGQTFYGNTDANGNFSIRVPNNGSYTILAQPYSASACTNLTLCNNPAQTITIVNPGDTSTNNVFAADDLNGFDLKLFTRWGSGNPGFEKVYEIFPYNSSSNAFPGPAVVTFIYDSALIYQNSSIAASHNPTTHTLSWSINSLLPLQANSITVTFLVALNTPLNSMLQADFSISPTVGDCDISSNHIHSSDIVTGSYDPNEKHVEPAGKITEQDSILTYTIYFQNTGTDSTHFIILKDTLSAQLEVTSVRTIASSHPYSEFSVSGSSILTWTFNPLRLVDSFTNEPGSHGFVKFTVKKKANMPIGDIISNRASIYFDYNEPVLTNTVADTMFDPTFIFEPVADAGFSVHALPNPFSGYTKIVVEGLADKFDFELLDLTGRSVKQITAIHTNTFTMERDALAPGIYIYHIMSAQGKSVYGKLMAK